jgi:hypothetical protein
MYRTSGSTITDQWNNLTLISESIGDSISLSSQFASTDIVYVKCNPSLDNSSLGYIGGNAGISTPMPTPTPTPTPIPLPTNDSFYSASLLSETISVFTRNDDATSDSSDPNGVSGKKSLWWKLEPTIDGTAVVTTLGSNFDTLLYAYKLNGEVSQANLTQIVYNDDSSGTTSKVEFAVVSGSIYYIAVVGYNGSTGTIQLNYST